MSKALSTQTAAIAAPALLTISDASMMKSTIAAIRENLGDEQIASSDLEIIKIPSGGSIQFTVQTPEGEQSEKELRGVIVAQRTPRGYWSKPFGSPGGKQAPDCSSADGITGTGNPGGDCNVCPFAQFGSGFNQRGEPSNAQACKKTHQLFTLMGDALLPSIIRASPASLKPVRQYMLSLAKFGKPFHAVLTSFTLVRQKSADGIDYAELQLAKLRDLTPEEAAQAAAYKQMFAGVMGQIPLHVEQDD